MTKAIEKKQTEIDEFLAQPVSSVPKDNRMVLNVPLDENTGNILVRGNSEFIDGRGVRMVIDKVPNKSGLPYTIVTGFPIK